jgi:hypothetical protein
MSASRIGPICIVVIQGLSATRSQADLKSMRSGKIAHLANVDGGR